MSAEFDRAIEPLRENLLALLDASRGVAEDHGRIATGSGQAAQLRASSAVFGDAFPASPPTALIRVIHLLG
jgi:hypothetical protein